MSERQSHEEPYKRFACDRCHTQKLRCIRNDGPGAEGEPCVRCDRANALCVYSPSERLGRPPDKSKLKNPLGIRNSSRKRRRCEADTVMEWAANSTSGLDGSIPGTNLWDTVEPHQTCPQDPQPSQRIGVSSNNMRHHQSELGHKIGSNEDSLPHSKDHDMFRSSTHGLSDDFELYGSPLESLAMDCFQGTTPGVDGMISHDFSTSVSTMLQNGPIVLENDSDHLTGALELDCSGAAPLNTANENYEETTQRLCYAPSDAKEKCMVQLSDIIIRLFKQLKSISSGSSIEVLSSSSPISAPLDGSAAFDPCSGPTTPIGDAFRISQDLIQILKSFEPISESKSRPTAVASRSSNVEDPSYALSEARPISEPSLQRDGSRESNGRKNSDSRSPRFSTLKPTPSNSLHSSMPPTSSIRYPEEMTQSGPSFNTDGYFPKMPHSSSKTEPSIESLMHSKSANLLQLDIPIMLLVITCHNRLTDIYNVFFTHCLRILKDYPSAADRVLLPEILPCLELGGFKPPNYGSLQISIIIEASMHMISRIEEYLQRPNKGQQDGVGSEVPALQLMDLVMKDDGMGFLGDGGSSSQLKENIEAIKRLIKK